MRKKYSLGYITVHFILFRDLYGTKFEWFFLMIADVEIAW